MYKTLLRPPLEQTLVLLWALGLFQVTIWLVQARPLAALTGTALVGAALSVLVSGRLRRPFILTVAVVLGLVAVHSIAARLGASGPLTRSTPTALYGLLLWGFVVRTLRWPGSLKAAALLGMRGGYGGAGGRAAVESVVHWSSAALQILALAGYLSGRAACGIPPAPPPALLVTLVFLWLAGRRYRLQSHTYALLWLGLWGVLTLYGGAHGAALQDSGLGLAAALYGLAAWTLGQRLAARATPAGDGTPSDSLYAGPLQVCAAILAPLAAAQAVLAAPAGATVSPAWPGILSCGVAALVLLLPNHTLPRPALPLFGALLGTLALSWLYSASMYGSFPSGLRPGGPVGGDQWLLLALASLGLASAGVRMGRSGRWAPLYAGPLFLAAALAYAWTLAGALVLLARGDTAYLAAVFGVLLGGLFPLLKPVGEIAAELRGVGVALLSTLLAAVLLGTDLLTRWGAPAGILWAYALWAGANLLLPRFNGRLPAWAVAPRVWPWLGLISLASALLLHPRAVLHWAYLLAGAGYLFLMLRNSAWAGFPWLAALALASVGVAFGLERHLDGLVSLKLSAAGSAAIEMLLWANALLLAARFWGRYGDPVAAQLGWRTAALHRPLVGGAFGLLGLWLILLALWDAAVILVPGLGATGPGAVLVGTLLALSLLHGLSQWPTATAAQVFVLGVFCGVLAGWGTLQPFHLPLLLALWAGAVLLVRALAPAAGSVIGLALRALDPWAEASAVAALAALALMPGVSTAERVLTLAVLSATAAGLGWRRRERAWLYWSAAGFVALLHGLWLVWVPVGRAAALLPWVSLELALLTWGARFLCARLARAGAAGRTGLVAQTLEQTIPWLAALAVAEWLLHLAGYAHALSEGARPQTLAGTADSLAALLSVLLMLAAGIAEGRHRGRAPWVYGNALLAGLAAVYLRLLWAGFAPLSAWDTAAVMAAAYGLFLLQRLTLSSPLLHLTMLLPLLAIATVPFQLGSGHAALTLLSAATLYLLTRRATQAGMPLYLGLLALNGAVYLWVPDWAQRFGLLQVYLIPASLSVLLLLHLHRREIRASVLNGARLAALSTLYAAATLDVFLRADFGVFVLALGLSLAGIALGIGTRTRAFLYAGMAFLVLNVLGQLVQLYPEQRLGRALLLMALGAIITALMVWFNLKRESVLRGIRVFRADLESWE
jgi:hypothetical protein